MTYLAMKPTIITKLFTAITIGYLLPFQNDLQGFDNQRIQDLVIHLMRYNLYSHYTLSIPNNFTQQLLLSGNYILKILNEDKVLSQENLFL
jgi:hypothetical protein